MTTIPGLIQQDAIEVVPDAVKLLQSAYNEVKQLLNSIEDSESAMNDVLLKHSLTSHNACNAVQLGLLYSSLCEPAFAAKAFKFLLLTTKDNLNLAVTEISRLLGEYWAKLLDTPRRQLLWLFHELVKSNTINAEHVLHHLLRRMTGGDLSPLNLWLVETVLDILSQHRHNWLDKKAVVPVVVYSYLRIIADHAAPVSHGLQGALERLRKREIDFVLPLLRDNFTDCLSIGRDLLRLLQDLAKLPEFERLWSEILHSPTSLSPKFTGVSQLLAQPPSPVCITSRLTHDMEQRIKWYLKFVHMGSHKRYLDWLTRKYLNTPESQSLRVDWIRFVVTQVHPSNETIASEVVQRWAFISWLILSCTSPTVVCNMKLALYYDWLMFDPAQHNLMNIEPGVLVIQNNLARSHQQHLAIGMLDFLCRLADNYYPALAGDLRRRLRLCLLSAVERKVVHSLAHIFDLAKMDKQMHGLLRHTFADLVPAQAPQAAAAASARLPDPASAVVGGLQPTPIYDSAIIVSAASSGVSSSGVSSSGGIARQTSTPPASSTSGGGHHHESLSRSATPPPKPPTPPAPPAPSAAPASVQPDVSMEPSAAAAAATFVGSGGGRGRRRSESAEFSDAEMSDAENGAGGGAGGTVGGASGAFFDLRRDFQRLKLRCHYQVDRVDIESYLQQLDPVMRDRLMQLRDESDTEAQCEIMYQVVQGIIEEEDIDLDFSRRIATCLCEICHSQLEDPIFPGESADASSLEDSVSTPIFVICRTLCQYSEDDPKRQPLYLLLSEMAARHPRIGYYLLYFLKVDRAQSQDDKFVAYKEFCKSQENPDLRTCLFKDLNLLAQDDPRLLAYLLPDVFRNFASQCQNNPHLMRIIVSSIDCSQLQTMVADIMQGHLELFRKDNLVTLLRDSLSWESVEQLFLWQLLNAQDLPTERFLPLLPHLDSGRHAEATTNLLLMLKLEQPSFDLVCAVLWREPQLTDPLCPSILHFWSEQKLDRLAEILNNCLMSPGGGTAASAHGGRGGGSSRQSPPPLEQSLRHLDIMRQRLRNLSLLQHELMQEALREVVRAAPAELRYTFIDLLALAADDLDDEQAGGRTRSLRAVPSRKAAAAARGHPSSGASSGGGSGGGGPQKRSSSGATRSSGGGSSGSGASGSGGAGGGRGDNSSTSSSSSSDDDGAASGGGSGAGGSSGGAGIANRRRQRAKKRLRHGGTSVNSSDSGLSNSDIFTTDYQ
ncbi:hypothetical protein BOX15_Mlig000413g4 [Macrostomum lignano]|uniref:SOSS complex subunit A homolog n=1 Tax=Macrostomum lignano TaxID=282301 RepID=A0A267G1C3_9PLAT|nr:hypothetical protein BOX15_Mlig000413g4 [Macrostomum lignano]